jgi:hypothetical protein
MKETTMMTTTAAAAAAAAATTYKILNMGSNITHTINCKY